MNEPENGTGSTAASLSAGALEAELSAMTPHALQPSHCLNCQTQLAGAYCHACGQQGHLHRTIRGFFHDLLHGALHFEGKIWRTLPMLAFRPGTLTRRYIEGARARYVSPMALFLFSVFLMFAVFQALGITAPATIRGETDIAAGIDEARELARNEMADSRAELAALSTSDPAGAAAQARLDEAESQSERLEDLATLAAREPEVGAQFGASNISRFGASTLQKWRENPSLMLYKLQANSYKFSWLLIPLSLPFVWLLFAWKRDFTGYDHAIFITYSLSFMSLLFIAASLLAATGLAGGVLALPVAIIALVHLYKQLRGAYSLSRPSALWRLLILLAMILMILALFVQVLLLIGAF